MYRPLIKVITLTTLTLLTALTGLAQNKEYARSVLKDLCSPEFYGRGYVNQGDRIAADYIAGELAKWKTKKFESDYLQPFNMRINSMNKADILFDTKKLKAGLEYLVEAQSPTLQGTFPVIYADAKALKRPNSFFNQINETGPCFILLDSVGLSNPQLYSFAKNLIQSKLISPKGVIEIVHRVPFGVVRKNFDDFVRIQLLNEAVQEPINEITVDIENHYNPAYPTQNVIGYLKGRSDEWIVFTAHYDSEGMHGDAIFPGASDNGSGTAMVLDLARHYSKGKKPHYNIAFMLFSGEEAGLLGSNHYVDHPFFPLEDIRMVINLDMVGTGQSGCTLFNGTVWPNETDKILSINQEENYLWLIRPVGPAANSDHHPFHLKGVPAIFFITGGKSGGGHTSADTEEALPLYAYDNLFRLINDFVNELPLIPME